MLTKQTAAVESSPEMKSGSRAKDGSRKKLGSGEKRLVQAVAALVVAALACSNAVARAQPCGSVSIPAEFVARRVFATPTVATDGRKLRLWVDSDGGGFIFDDVARRYKTFSSATNAPRPLARLPAFAGIGRIPAPSGRGGLLSILARSDVGSDPIFRGMDGQLGASWLMNRVWTIDYPRRKLAWRCGGADPPHLTSQVIPLAFAVDARGKLFHGVQYPQMELIIDGHRFLASLDTAATVALSTNGIDAPKGGLPVISGTSFAKRAIVTRWHSLHKAWPFVPNAGLEPGISAIRIPLVRAGPVRFHDVWFTTRPSDDVFGGETVDLKLGPTAFGGDVLTLDYPRRLAIIQPPQ
jgi:hypothetical protein